MVRRSMHTVIRHWYFGEFFVNTAALEGQVIMSLVL